MTNRKATNLLPGFEIGPLFYLVCAFSFFPSSSGTFCLVANFSYTSHSNFIELSLNYNKPDLEFWSPSREIERYFCECVCVTMIPILETKFGIPRDIVCECVRIFQRYLHVSLGDLGFGFSPQLEFL